MPFVGIDKNTKQNAGTVVLDLLLKDVTMMEDDYGNGTFNSYIDNCSRGKEHKNGFGGQRGQKRLSQKSSVHREANGQS